MEGNSELEYNNSGNNSFNNSFNSNQKKNQQNRRSDPYRRVREDNISVDGRLLNNSLKAKVRLAIILAANQTGAWKIKNKSKIHFCFSFNSSKIVQIVFLILIFFMLGLDWLINYYYSYIG